MEPVEIDFIYGGNTQTEGKKIEQSMDNIAQAQAKATSMAERHNAAILELRKDLVGFGAAYKQATTKAEKSEILTEIEITKKNILDEIAALKQLKAEMATMSRAKPASVLPDASQVGKAAVGYNSLSFSTQQLVRELPAATMGLNMFFLAISNNIPVLTDGIKRARAENEALKASGASGVPVWKQLVSSLFSWQSAMMVGITVLSIYGKDIISFVSKLFTGKEAIDKTAESQKALNKVFSDFTGNAARKIEDVVKMGIEIETYGNKAENSKGIIDNFNKTFNTHLTTIDQVRAAYPKLSEAAITAAVKIQAANSLIEKSARAVLKKQEADTALSPYSAKQVREQEAQLNKLVSLSKKYGADMNELTTKLVSGEGFGVLGVTGYITGFATKVEKEDISKLSELSNFFSNEDNLWFAKYLSQQRKYGKLMALENKEIGKILAGVEYKDFSPTSTPNPTSNKGKGTFGLPADQELANKMLDMRKGINDKLKKQREEFIKESQQAQKMGGDKELQELRRIRSDADQIVLRSGTERERIEKEYADRIATLRKDSRFNEIAQQEAERDQKISIATKGMVEETGIYKLLTDDKLKIAKSATEKLLVELKKRIAAEISANNLSTDDGNALLADIIKAQFTVQKTNNPFADLIDGVEKYRKAREAQSDFNTNKDIVSFDALETAAKEAHQATMEAASGALQGIGNIVRDVTSQIEGLTDAEKQAIAQVEGLIEGASTLATGLATDDPAAILQGSIGILSNLYKLLDTQAKEVENQLKNNKKAVDDLNIAYDNLSNAIEKAFGTEKARLIQEQIALLEQKKAIIEESMQAELNKDANYRKPKWWEYAIPGWGSFQVAKGLLRPKTDEDAITQYKKDLADIERDLKEKIEYGLIEAVTGTSVMSAIDEFANAYADAFTSGENAALKSSEIVRNIIKKELVEKLKTQLQGPIADLMKSIADAVATGSDGGTEITQAEKDAIAAKKKKIDELAAQNKKEFEDLGYGDSAQKGIQGGVKNMTEETGSALTGQIVAMRLNVAALLANSKSSVDMMSKQLAALEAIKTNTDRLNRIDDTLYYIKQNGIKVQ